MIPVTPRPEPPAFDRDVRQPGSVARTAGTSPLPDYWRKCLDDLYNAYGGICAYLAIRIPSATGARTVDHFAPKSRHPDLAYEWSNYRLVCGLMNARKRDFEDVLDPFTIEDGWFVLDLTFLDVKPAPGLPKVIREDVQATIDRLKLNDSECIRARKAWYDPFLEGEISSDFFERCCPFVAKEHNRQNMARLREALS